MEWIANFLNKIISAIADFFAFIWDLVLSCLSWFLDAIKWLFFESFFWALDTFLNIIEGCLTWVGFPNAFEWSAGFYSQINYFVPLNELFVAMLFLFGVWITCFSVKVVLKLCPTIY